MRRWLAAAVVLLLAAALRAPSPARAGGAPDTTRVESAHYVLTSEGPEDEAREFSRVLEAAWPQLEAFFGVAPKLGPRSPNGERLRVRFFETAAAMKTAIVEGGGVAPDSGGYFCPVARTSYAWRQPSRWYTRTLLIHEATHQFHLLGVVGGANDAPGWWKEGLAEHLSHHTWDGTTLRLGVVPPTSLEDRPAKALAAAEAKGFTADGIVTKEPLDRPDAMHLVRFLATGDDGKPLSAWKPVEKTLDRGGVVKPREVTRGFPTPAAFRARYVEWLRTVQQPLVSEFVEWDSLAADSLRGRSAVVSICRTRGDAQEVAATVAVADMSKPFRVGVLLEWRSQGEYVVGEIDGDGTRVRVDRMEAGKWTTLLEGPLPDGAGTSPWKVAAVRGEEGVVFRVGEADVYTLASGPGPLGFCLDHCVADFRGFRIR